MVILSNEEIVTPQFNYMYGSNLRAQLYDINVDFESATRVASDGPLRHAWTKTLIPRHYLQTNANQLEPFS